MSRTGQSGFACGNHDSWDSQMPKPRFRRTTIGELENSVAGSQMNTLFYWYNESDEGERP